MLSLIHLVFLYLNPDTRMNDTMTSFEAWPGRMEILCLLVVGIKQFMSIPQVINFPWCKALLFDVISGKQLIWKY